MSKKSGVMITSLCAVALATGYRAQAQNNVQISLNLRYNDPGDPSQGGTWTIVAATDAANGLAGVNSYISNIDATGVTYGAGINAATNNGQPFVIAGTPTNVLYFQDTSAPGVVVGVGKGAGTAGNQQDDPLHSGSWNNVAVIASGTYGGNRPVFAPQGINVTDANVLSTPTPPFNQSINANTTFIVRGDSVATLGLEAGGAGLLRGDLNRDFVVNGDDLARLLFFFNTTDNPWDDGDVTGGLGGHVEGVVDGDDLANLLFNFNTSSTPPGNPAAGISAAPEPASAALAGLAAIILAASRRRSS